MPPAPLISALASSRPSLAWLPNSSSPPENGCTTPNLIGSDAASAGRGNEPARTVAAAPPRNSRRLVMCKPSPGREDQEFPEPICSTAARLCRDGVAGFRYRKRGRAFVLLHRLLFGPGDVL